MRCHKPSVGIQLILIGALLTLAAPVADALAQEEPTQQIIREKIEYLREFRRLQIDNADIAAIRVVPQLYERRNFLPAWTRPGTVDQLIRAIEESREEGLVPGDYHYTKLKLLRQQVADENGADPAKHAGLDLLLTDGLIRLAYHILVGKVDPERLDPNWNLAYEIRDVDPALAIQRAIDSDSVYHALQTLEPQHVFYADLKKALAAYRGIQEAGGWPGVPTGPTLKKGMSDSRISTLRKRLGVTGELHVTASDTSLVFDGELETAVIGFQKSHGLDADGVVGARTVDALNLPVSTRIDQIRVNLERARWVLRDLDDTFVVVNIAGFRVSYFKGNQMKWAARAQVGKPFRETPVFKADMKYLVFNPTWTVPPTILDQDMLPAVKRNPSYLKSKNIDVLDANGHIIDQETIDWSLYTGKNFPYILRQGPGPANALGRVKFIFPNEHFVFLHDTPSKGLFERTSRAFSSGCIRVESPFELAELLLDDPETWTQKAIKQVLDSEKPRTVYLRNPIPVLLVYFTVSFDKNRDLVFFPDIYNRDAAVLEDLNAGFRFRERDVVRRGDGE